MDPASRARAAMARYGQQWGEVGLIIPEAAQLGIQLEETAVVAVNTDSLARGLLHPGDVIASLNHVRHESLSSLTQAFRDLSPGPYQVTVRPPGGCPGPDEAAERYRLHQLALAARDEDPRLRAREASAGDDAGETTPVVIRGQLAQLQFEAPDSPPRPPPGWTAAAAPQNTPDPGDGAGEAEAGAAQPGQEPELVPADEEWAGRGRDQRSQWLAQMRGGAPEGTLPQAPPGHATPGVSQEGQQHSVHVQEELARLRAEQVAEQRSVDWLSGQLSQLDERLARAQRVVGQLAEDARSATGGRPDLLTPAPGASGEAASRAGSFLPRVGEQVYVVRAATGSHGFGYTLRFHTAYTTVDLGVLLVSLHVGGEAMVRLVDHAGEDERPGRPTTNL